MSLSDPHKREEYNNSFRTGTEKAESLQHEKVSAFCIEEG